MLHHHAVAPGSFVGHRGRQGVAVHRHHVGDGHHPENILVIDPVQQCIVTRQPANEEAIADLEDVDGGRLNPALRIAPGDGAACVGLEVVPAHRIPASRLAAASASTYIRV